MRGSFAQDGCGRIVEACIKLAIPAGPMNQTRSTIYASTARSAGGRAKVVSVARSQMQSRLIEAYLIMGQRIKSILYIKWKMQSATETGMPIFSMDMPCIRCKVERPISMSNVSVNDATCETNGMERMLAGIGREWSKIRFASETGLRREEESLISLNYILCYGRLAGDSGLAVLPPNDPSARERAIVFAIICRACDVFRIINSAKRIEMTTTMIIKVIIMVAAAASAAPTHTDDAMMQKCVALSSPALIYGFCLVTCFHVHARVA